MKKTLVLQFIDYGIFPFENYKEKIYIKTLFKNNDLIYKLFRKTSFVLNLPFYKIIFSHWLSIASKVDTIIIFDNNYAPIVVQYLHKIYPQKRIVVWYWNSVDNTISPDKFDRSFAELWSFDEGDCKKYNLKFNTQFYCNQNENIDYINSQYDILFVGTVKNKERLKELKEIKKVLENNLISTNFYLVQGQTKYDGVKYKLALSYKQIIGLIKKCNCILDLSLKGQLGLSLRPLEALYFNKKLITNNSSIKNSKLYNKNNVYYLENESISGKRIKHFLEIPYDNKNSEYLKKYYSFPEWIKRFY